MTREFSVRVADWTRDQAALRSIRHAVFVVEQHVAVELEWDGLDDTSVHLLAEDSETQPIGCARVLEDGHVGRMAVLDAWRGYGVGRVLLRAALAQCAAAGFREALLNAQTHALGFYEREGFEAFGSEFLDAGIAHRAMRRLLRR